jgi:hypothetical protein
MINIVGMSGGRSSLHLARKLQLMGYNPVCLFADTGFEHDETYSFIKRCVSEFNLNAHFIRAEVNGEGVGNTPIELSIDDIGYRPETFAAHFAKYGTPTFHAKNCTDRLKGIVMDKWKDENFGRKNYVTWTGFRADETRRIKDREQQLELVGFEADKKKVKVNTNQRYLADISEESKSDIIKMWKDSDFDLGIGEHNGNCLFCIHKSCEKLALSARENQEKASDWIELVNDSNVRTMPRNKQLPPDIMYRGYHSLNSIINTFKDYSNGDLAEAINKGRKFDSGSCSESCDPTPQLSLVLDDHY